MKPVSNNLNKLLGLEEARPLKEINLTHLGQALARSFRDKEDIVRRLLNANGTMNVASILSHLDEIADEDSVVRDILTTGHLAKLLSRTDLLRDPVDYALVGVPNKVFDAASQDERQQYFRDGSTLTMTQKVDQLRVIMDREKAIMGE